MAKTKATEIPQLEKDAIMFAFTSGYLAGSPDKDLASVPKKDVDACLRAWKGSRSAYAPKVQSNTTPKPLRGAKKAGAARVKSRTDKGYAEAERVARVRRAHLASTPNEPLTRDDRIEQIRQAHLRMAATK